MNKRIRYYEKEPKMFQSVRVVKTDQGEVLVRYFPDTLLVAIIKANEPETVIDSFTSTTPHEMKKAIKAKLVSMGAVFKNETRERGDETMPIRADG